MRAAFASSDKVLFLTASRGITGSWNIAFLIFTAIAAEIGRGLRSYRKYAKTGGRENGI